MNTRDKHEKASQVGHASSGGGQPRQISVRDNRIDSIDLFVDGKEIVIAHGTELYRLRLTAQHKLILTK